MEPVVPIPSVPPAESLSAALRGLSYRFRGGVPTPAGRGEGRNLKTVEQPDWLLGRDTIHVLVFELDGQLYGIDVDQVEAIMEGEGWDGLPTPEGVSYVPSGAEGRTCSYEGQEVPIRYLASWIGLGQPDPTQSLGTGKQPSTIAPRVLLSRSSGVLQGFLVDTPKDIIALAVVDIFPIPNLIQQLSGPTPLWAVGRSPGGLLLLVDLAANWPPVEVGHMRG
jgi:chemotaxis signal transduction protein